MTNGWPLLDYADWLDRALTLQLWTRIVGKMAAMVAPGVKVHIDRLPKELPHPIAFDKDAVHACYNAAAARHFWQALVQNSRSPRLLWRDSWFSSPQKGVANGW